MANLSGLQVALDLDCHIASLRYLDAGGSFAADVREALGQPMPGPLRADRAGSSPADADYVLVWRSPTETLLLTKSARAFEGLQRRLAGASDGCMVDQTGGVRVVRVEGERSADLIVRLGAATAIPAIGEARSSRLAELTVLTACIRPGEFLMLVERAYADHLLQWMDVTAADFAGSS